MAYTPSELKLIVNEQKATIRELRNGIDNIRRLAQESVDAADRNRWKRNSAVEKVLAIADKELEFLDIRSARLKCELTGPDRGQSTLKAVGG